MIANHWIEPYTLQMGVKMMNAVTEALCVSGLIYAPFLVALILSMVEAMTQGQDEGNAGELAVKFFRKRLLMMMPVFLMAFLPAMSVNSSNLTHVAPMCADPATPKPTEKAVTMIGNFNGGTTMAPVFWAVAHDVSSVITNVATAMIPCPADITAIVTNIDNSAFNGNSQQQLLHQEWGKSCLTPAAGNVAQGKAYDKSWWVGHPDFLAEYSKEGSVLRVPVEVATGLGLSGTEIGGEATIDCAQSYQYLFNKKLEELSGIDGYNTMIEQLSEQYKMDATETANKVVGMQLGNAGSAFPTFVKLSSGKIVSYKDTAGISNQEDNPITRGIAMMMTAMANVINAPDAITYRQAAPIQIAVVQMVMLMVAPLIICFSGFDMATTIKYTGLYFGLEFTMVITAASTWMYNFTHTFLYGSDLEYAASASLQLYELLPTVWFVFLGLIGINIIQGLSGNLNSAKGAGGRLAQAASFIAGGIKAGAKVGAAAMKK